MKNLYTIKNRLIISISLLLTVFIIHSCKRDNYSEVKLPDKVAAAKTWYESVYPQMLSNPKGLATQSISDESDPSQIVKPDWKNAATYTRLGQNVIEMPVDPTMKLVLIFKTNTFAFNKDYSRSYYILLGDKQKYQAYILTFLADSTWVNNDLSKLAQNSYRKVAADFTGWVVYNTPKGEYLGGYGYKSGKLITPSTANTASENPKVQSLDGGVLKPNNMVQVCTDNYYRLIYQNADGTESYGPWEYVDTTCTNVDDGGGTSGGGSGSGTGSTGGGSSSSPTPPPPKPCPPSSGTQACTVPVADALKTNFIPAPTDPGAPPPPTSSPCTVTTKNCAPMNIIDSLTRHFPCAVKLILNVLMTNPDYNTFIAPFESTRKPNIIWKDGPLMWQAPNPVGGSGTITMLGNTSTSATGDPNNVDRDATITLNTSMLQNSSQLMIAATEIHETLHAYIHYNIVTAVGFPPPTGYTGSGNWMYAMDTWATMKGLPTNYSNHYQMLSDYFSKAVSILKAWDNSAHTDKEYEMAMLFGLDNANDGNATQKAELQTEYNNICSTYHISSTDLNTFYSNQLNATTNKLPTTGCN